MSSWWSCYDALQGQLKTISMDFHWNFSIILSYPNDIIKTILKCLLSSEMAVLTSQNNRFGHRNVTKNPQKCVTSHWTWCHPCLLKLSSRFHVFFFKQNFMGIMNGFFPCSISSCFPERYNLFLSFKTDQVFRSQVSNTPFTEVHRRCSALPEFLTLELLGSQCGPCSYSLQWACVSFYQIAGTNGWS